MDNPFRQAGDVDRTTLEAEKLRANADVRKKEIEEREKTKRAKIEASSGDAGQVRAFTKAVALVILGIATAVVVNTYIERSKPFAVDGRLPNCNESAEVISVSDAKRTCDNGYSITEKLAGDKVLHKCVCSRLQVAVAEQMQAYGLGVQVPDAGATGLLMGPK